MNRSRPPASIDTVVQLLRWRAAETPDTPTFTFLLDGEHAAATMTVAELERRASGLAARLLEDGLEGQRALLVFPPGLDYLVALFACLLARVVAVPTYPPSWVLRDPGMERLSAVVADCDAAVGLTSSAQDARALSAMPLRTRNDLRWLATEETPPGPLLRPPTVGESTLAMLQYTSGSTAAPKGVMLSHGNVIANACNIQRTAQPAADDHALFWLPMYHDFGLFSAIMQPLYSGCRSTLMSPWHFLQRPARWLQAISRRAVTVSGAPNFAFDLCVRKISAEQKVALDLGALRYVSTGGEPVRAATLERFADAFASCGFRRNALRPGYGLAEATFQVTIHERPEAFGIRTVDAKALRDHRVVAAPQGARLVSCGPRGENLEVVVVDPQSLQPCSDDRIGEIWVRGPIVASGYWNAPAATAAAFGARLAPSTSGDDAGGKTYLRTGDLGFLSEGELYVTGRIKDLIIIDGQNHYPQDIELTVQQCDPRIRPGCAVAFSIDDGATERLVVGAEVSAADQPPSLSDADVEELTAVLRSAVFRAHGVPVHAVRLLPPGSVLKTSSGKLRRIDARAAFLSGSW